MSNEKIHPDHDCWMHEKVIECKDDIDKVECRLCGKIYTRPCNFDEDMS